MSGEFWIFAIIILVSLGLVIYYWVRYVLPMYWDIFKDIKDIWDWVFKDIEKSVDDSDTLRKPINGMCYYTSKHCVCPNSLISIKNKQLIACPLKDKEELK